MTKKISFLVTALCLALTSAATMADDAAITAQLTKLGVTEIEVKSSPISGLKTVITNEGILYVSDNGKYAIQGKLFEITDKGVVDMTGKFLLDKLNTYKNEMIVYPAKNEKHVVTVFLDTTCYYCNKLHEQMKEYNDLGITVRYLAFPRSGMNSKTAEEMEAIFTAKDPVFALNEAQKGNPPKALKTPDIVKKHYDLGVQFGVRGTPSIVSSDGEIIGGYLPPQQLLNVLENKE